MGECKNCANNDSVSGIKYCFVCDDGDMFKPITNGDKIRQMTDEEISHVIDKGCPPDYEKRDCAIFHRACCNCWLDWLREAAEE